MIISRRAIQQAFYNLQADYQKASVLVRLDLEGVEGIGERDGRPSRLVSPLNSKNGNINKVLRAGGLRLTQER
jgi:hypothetical protein